MSRIEVFAEARYLPGESATDVSRFVFAYDVTVRHLEGEPARLVTRHWWITDGSGAVQEVRGSGVVGKQPRLLAGEEFSYTSAAVLDTPVGAMHGYYEFVTDEGRRFEAAIPAFTLSVPNMRH